MSNVKFSRDKIVKLSILLMTMLTPLFNLIAANLNELQRSSYLMVIETFLVLLILAVAVFFVFYILERLNVLLGRFFYFFSIPLLFLFFNFSVIYNSLQAFFAGPKAVLLSQISFIFIVFLIFGFAVLCCMRDWATKLINTMCVTLFLFSSTALAVNSMNITSSAQDEGFSEAVLQSAKTTEDLANVYYIVADGLTGPENYERLTNESLAFFSSGLEKYGFLQIKNARSNYLGSASSIGSIFHLNYFRDETSDLKTPHPSHYFPAVFFKDNVSPALQTLTKLGMEINFSGSWYTTCRGKQIKCLHGDRFFFNRFTLRLIDNSMLSYFSSSAIGAAVPVLLRRKIDAITPVTSFLNNGNMPAKNQFVFVHHMQPHDPWYYDETCQHISTRGQERGELYRKSVRCLSKTFIEFMNAIETKDPNAIVILHGDHGWLNPDDANGQTEDKWDEDLLFFRTEISNFVKLPIRCSESIRDGLGPVNTMRLVLACLEYKEPKFLEEFLFVPAETYSQTGKLFRRPPALMD